MVQKRLIAGLSSLVIFCMLGVAGLASAQSFRSGNNVTTNAGSTIDESLYASGRTIDIGSDVNGDVFCAGQNITISGAVHGDVICAGQSITVSGKVDGDVRLAAQTINLNSTIDGSATVLGESLSVGANGTIGRDLSVGSTDTTINGKVGRDVAAGGSNLVVAGSIGRNIKGSLNSLTLSSGSQVQGDITYTSKNDVNRASDAVVNGNVTRNDPPKSEDKSGFNFGWFIYWFLAMLLTALALVLLFPGLIHSSSERAMRKPWKVLLTGFLATLVVPVLLVVLAVTLVGIPLAIVLGLLWIVILVFSGPALGYLIGRFVLKDSRKPLLIMLAGMSILLVALAVPFLNFFVFIATVWLGTGMLILELFDRTPRPAYDLAVPATRTKR